MESVRKSFHRERLRPGRCFVIVSATEIVIKVAATDDVVAFVVFLLKITVEHFELLLSDGTGGVGRKMDVDEDKFFCIGISGLLGGIEG